MASDYNYVTQTTALATVGGAVAGFFVGKHWGHALVFAIAGAVAGFLGTRNMAGEILWDSTNGFASLTDKSA